MKTVNKYLFLLAAVVFGLTACEKQQEREPSPAGNPSAIAFEQGNIYVEINPAKAELAYEITVGRTSTDSALTATIHAEGDTDIISVPAEVTFAKGEAEKVLKLEFPKAEVDSSYTVTLSVDSANLSPYTSGNTSCKFTVAIAAWEPATTKAIVFDGIVNVFYSTGTPGWYVSYLRKDNADGSFDIRLLNPYTVLPDYLDGDYDSPIADNFGLYKGFPYNYPEDVDSKGTYNLDIHVLADGSATFDQFELGMTWSNGSFAGLHAASRGMGVYDATANVITFAGGTVACAMSEYNSGGFYLGAEDFVIYLDSKAYQNDHLSIADYNDPTIEWTEQESVVNQFESTIFNFKNEEQKLFKAVDQYEGNEKSPFINLYCLKDAYAKGGNLAFYWNGEDNDSLDIPVPQNTKLSFMGKDLYILDAEGAVVTSEVKGTKVKVFTFNISVASKDGDAVGDFTETFSMAEEAIIFEKSDFIGNFALAGYSPFDGTPMEQAIEIKEENDNLFILGVTRADTIWVEFDAETGLLSVAPQTLPNIFTYSGTDYPTELVTFDEDFNITNESPLIFGYNLSGECLLQGSQIGYLIRAVGLGNLAGCYDLSLTRASAVTPAPAKVPLLNRIYKNSDLKKQEIRTNGHKPSVSGLSFQGKRIKAAKAL